MLLLVPLLLWHHSPGEGMQQGVRLVPLLLQTLS
jgi:hypothetical protein